MCESKDNLKEEWEETVRQYNELKENFHLNPYHFPDIKSMSLHIFYKLFKNVDIESIDALEGQWLKKAFSGGLRYAIPGEYEETELYDVNSLYPHILAHKQIKIPIGTPQFSTLETLPEKIKTGLYKAKIKNTRELLFYKNNHNIYTNFDINRAIELGLEIELIQNDGPNVMIYPEKKFILSTRLKKIIEQLYELKTQGIVLAKKVLNLIWGSVCSYNRKKLYTYINKEPIIVKSSDQIIPSDFINGEFEVFKQNSIKIFKSDFARFGPFLTSKARCYMSQLMEPYENLIVYSHTDSFLVKKNLKLKTSKLIGDIKLENKGKCLVKSKNLKTFI